MGEIEEKHAYFHLNLMERSITTVFRQKEILGLGVQQKYQKDIAMSVEKKNGVIVILIAKYLEDKTEKLRVSSNDKFINFFT